MKYEALKKEYYAVVIVVMSIPTTIELVQKNLIIETHNFLKIEHNGHRYM